ncbi:HAD-IA family hydrolase (plasmid) [Paracoccus marcusii]|uniref:HAD-IA family hydrolase n=1 Tax=Paracoccus marcusii TaxID=59779 RepID=UPI002ED3D584|nr:HAD-IA family hydrolase [Paracoccus marcusii]
MTFDVVGTLIDFESGLMDSLSAIAAEHGTRLAREDVLKAYRAERYRPDVQRFPTTWSGSIWPSPRSWACRGTRSWAGACATTPPAGSPCGLVAAMQALSHRYKLVAMTNAQRWAFAHFDATLGHPFHASFTTDDTGTEKPDPAFFHHVLTALEAQGVARDDILHVAQSQHHDMGVARDLGLNTCWIQRRHDQPGWGGTIAPAAVTVPDYHFTAMAELAAAVEPAFA